MLIVCVDTIAVIVVSSVELLVSTSRDGLFHYDMSPWNGPPSLGKISKCSTGLSMYDP